MINYDIVKRLIDIFLSFLLAILFLPVWLIIPLLIKVDSPGSMIYKHKRVGKNGKEFWMYKFRTMIANADEVLFKKNKKLLAKFKENDWKLKNDPRITKLGKLIRNLTIDEFPQLYNVLKGEMSIVGPRAYVRKEIEEQTARYPGTRNLIKKIYKVRPGITGPWQTSGRNDVPFMKRAKMDADYAKNYSLWEDLKIILKTPQAMITKW
jgi:lipopolysaccharide/colanic/teichoic acid biosynthesis glycosyltransferase